MSVQQAVQQIRDSVDANKGEVVGMLISFKVNQCEIPYDALRQSILDQNELDGSWIPEKRCPVSLFLDAKRALAGLRKGFEFDESLHGIKQDQHHSYKLVGVRSRNRVDANGVVCHDKVFHCTQQVVKHEDEHGNVTTRVEPIMDEQGLEFKFVRISGTKETDKTGGSQFQIKVQGLTKKPSYLPFFEKLRDEWADLMQENYNSSQISALIRSIVIDRAHGSSVNGNGLYFTHINEVDKVLALENALNTLDGESINFITIPLVKPTNEEAPEAKTFKSVARGVTESLMDEIRSLLKEIEDFKESDAKTRQGTWNKRIVTVNELKKRLAEYRKVSLLTSDTIEEALEDAETSIREAMDKEDV